MLASLRLRKCQPTFPSTNLIMLSWTLQTCHVSFKVLKPSSYCIGKEDKHNPMNWLIYYDREINLASMKLDLNPLYNTYTNESLIKYYISNSVRGWYADIILSYSLIIQISLRMIRFYTIYLFILRVFWLGSNFLIFVDWFYISSIQINCIFLQSAECNYWWHI